MNFTTISENQKKVLGEIGNLFDKLGIKWKKSGFGPDILEFSPPRKKCLGNILDDTQCAFGGRRFLVRYWDHGIHGNEEFFVQGKHSLYFHSLQELEEFLSNQ